MLTGSSIVLCVPEIASGRIPYPQVKKLVSTTTIKDQNTWEGFIAHCKRVLWTIEENTTPDECERILRKLLSEGKIEQPLLIEGGQHPGTEPFHWWDEEGKGITV